MRIIKYFIIELNIFLLIVVAEIYNVFSITNLTRVFYIEKWIERSCRNISLDLKNIIKYRVSNYKIDKIIVLSRLQKGGGLGKIYQKIKEKNISLTIITNIFQFRIISPPFKTKKSRFIVLNNIGIINRIEKLCNVFSCNSSNEIHLLNDTTDPLPYIAYLICSTNKKNFFFYHHADHSFSFGMFESNWHHIDLFQNQFQICKKVLKPKFNSMINFLWNLHQLLLVEVIKISS